MRSPSRRYRGGTFSALFNCARFKKPVLLWAEYGKRDISISATLQMVILFDLQMVTRVSIGLAWNRGGWRVMFRWNRWLPLTFGQRDKTWRNTVSGIAKGQLLATKRRKRNMELTGTSLWRAYAPANSNTVRQKTWVSGLHSWQQRNKHYRFLGSVTICF